MDVQNIYNTCRQSFSRNFDYNKFWAKVTNGREVISAYAYATDRGDDWDVGITLDVYEAAPHCDTVVLASGDGDFEILLRRITERFGTRTEVYGVFPLTAAALRIAADKYVPIEKNLLL